MVIFDIYKNNEKNNYLKNNLDIYGEYEELNDRINVYISQEYINEICAKKNSYIHLKSFKKDGDYLDIAKKYNLDKKINYIFDNITFDSKIDIYSYDSNVKIMNCIFMDSFRFICNNQLLVLENNIYSEDNNSNYLIYGKDNTVRIQNESIESECCFQIYASNLDCKNINITIDAFSIHTSNNYFVSSNIQTKVLFIEADKITAHDSNLNYLEKLEVLNKPKGMRGFVSKKKKISQRKIQKQANDELVLNDKRIDLIKELYLIKESINNEINNKTLEYFDNLKEQNIIKLIKK